MQELLLLSVFIPDKGVQAMMVCTDTRDEHYLESPWECEKCSFTIDYRTYFHIVHNTRLALHVVENDPYKLWKFMSDNMWPKGLLHKTHEFIFRAKFCIRTLQKGQLRVFFRFLIVKVYEILRYICRTITV